MNLLPEGLQLPAYAIAEDVNRLLRESNRLIITAAPGAGKSTLLPITLLDQLSNDAGKIVMLEPRRLATQQIAERMAYLIQENVGETIGYRVRFERRISSQTRIEVVTEGILAKRMIQDPLLEDVSIIIFDEFHERSIHSDTALAMALEIQQEVRPDLKIILMSATIDATDISKRLNAPTIDCKGRMFPVDIHRADDDASPENVAEKVAHYIRKAHTLHEGDILAFLPGQAEITRCQELLGTALGATNVYPLYGQLSAKEQQLAISPSPQGSRKVVLATSIAETSLTIEGVKIVIDGGFCRTMIFDQKNGLSHLVTQRISMDMATQRSGRAGRLSSGVCYRLWTLATEHRMEICREAEILKADLSPMILNILAWGESDISRLPWLTPPPSSSVEQSIQLLYLLGAIDTNRKATRLGKEMSALPCHPRIARMLLSSADDHTQALAADIAALIEEKDPIEKEEDTDINTRIALLRSARKKGTQGKWSRILHVAQEYRQIGHTKEANNTPSAFEVGALLASAYPERIAHNIDDCGRYKLSNGTVAKLTQGDSLCAYPWLAIATMNASSGNIFLASPLEVNNIPYLITEKENVSWDSKRGMLVMQREKRIGALVISTQPMSEVDRNVMIQRLGCAAVKEGLSMFNFSDDVSHLQRRIETTTNWHPELELPDISTESLLNLADEWLPYFAINNGKLMTTSTELKKIDMTQVIWSQLTYEQQQAIEKFAPSHVTVPTGSKIRIDYRQGAEIPIVSVRLQECFGLTDTPRINDGKQPLLMELLSPGYKPVQLTQDLGSFWDNTYFEVRKELKRRYPKHYWPDDPREAEAVRGVRRVKN